MANQITDDVTKGVSELVKIHLDDGEVSSYTSQLNTVLGAVEVLKELDTDSVVETSQTHGLTNVLAEDIPEPGLDIKEYPNTSNLEKSYFVVRKVL